MRICSSKQIALFLKDERGVEFGGSGNDQLRRRSRSVQHRTLANRDQRLSSAAVRAENVVCRDPATAKAAVDGGDLNSFAAQDRRRHTITDLAIHQLLEVDRQRVSQLTRRAKTIF